MEDQIERRKISIIISKLEKIVVYLLSKYVIEYSV